jgi:hypothetical protein
MSFSDALDRVAKEAFTRILDKAVNVAFETAPYDLGPLRDAIVATPIQHNGTMFTSEIDYGEPDVERQRGYYPGVLEFDPKYNHEGFVEDTVDQIANAIRTEIF